jgi:hypothetical protein
MSRYPKHKGIHMNRDETLDTELGEALFENEPQVALQIAEAIATKIQQGPRPAVRDAHPKAHGCVVAEFRVEDDLPQYLAQGVFTPGRTYPAYIRFSNGDPDPNRDDAKGDARGMAIKLRCRAKRSCPTSATLRRKTSS